MSNARLPDINTLIAAGFNPKTGLPYRITDDACDLKEAIKKQLRILDEQNAVNRYHWTNLPNGLTGQLVERMLYYRGQLAFFYEEALDSFYLLPFALTTEDGYSLDVYGRFRQITPIRFMGQGDKKENKVLLPGLVKNVIYDDDIDNMNESDFYNGCVLLRDYTNQMSETNIPRQQLQDPILDTMAEAFPFARTSLIANSGVRAMRVNDQNAASNVEAASRSITRAALTGKPLIPIVDPVEFQDLTNGSALKTEEYLIYMQAVDNYRLSLYGLKNGGLFQKKSHMLEAEQDMNNGTTSIIYEDGLTIRQRFCDIVNSIWGLGIWCEENPNISGVDPMMMMDNNQEESTTQEEGGEEDE